MPNLRGQIRAYVRTTAKGDAFTLSQIMRSLGLRASDEAEQKRVQAAVNGIRRWAEIDPDTDIILKTIDRGQVWQWENYVPQPIDQAAIAQASTPLPDGSDVHREVTAELEDDDELPPEEHVCAFTVVGMDADGKPLVRDSARQIWRLTEI